MLNGEGTIVYYWYNFQFISNSSITEYLFCVLVGESVVLDEHLFSNKALQEYILICCQAPFGGLIDKPEK